MTRYVASWQLPTDYFNQLKKLSGRSGRIRSCICTGEKEREQGMRPLRESAIFCLMVPAFGLPHMIRRTLTMILIAFLIRKGCWGR